MGDAKLYRRLVDVVAADRMFVELKRQKVQLAQNMPGQALSVTVYGSPTIDLVELAKVCIDAFEAEARVMPVDIRAPAVNGPLNLSTDPGGDNA